jgi:hypothetical protein
MNACEKKNTEWRNWISPLKLTLLAINAVCFGAFIVLLIVGKPSGPLVGITIATGLSLGAGLTGAIVASRKELGRPADASTSRGESRTIRSTE